MKEKYSFKDLTSLLLVLVAFLTFNQNSFAQCSAYTTNTACTSPAPTVINTSISCTPPNNNGGRRNFVVTNMIAGATYRVSNCGSGYNTQLTIFDATGANTLAFNDDNGPDCTGTAASIDFVAPATGDYRIQLNRSNCATTNVLNGTITVTYTAAPSMIVPYTGNNSYTTCSGTLYDNGGGSGNYVNNSNGYTVINPSTPGAMVQVSGTITTEGGWDYLTIYNGVGIGGTVLWGGSAHGSGTSCNTFTVPTITSTSGPLTIRFYSDSSNNCSGFALSISCYTFPACASPTSVATSLNLSAGSPATSAINGSFTAASPAPNNYLVVMSTSSTPPAAPTNGTSYTIGGTLAPGYTIIDNDTNTSFSATGLLGSTTYYFFIYSMNGGSCTGGPLYNNTPLTGNLTTATPPMTVPSSGNNSYTTCSGILYDNGGSAGNYVSSSNGYTVINPSTPGAMVQVSGTITAEGGYDYLTIYNGVGTGGTVLWGGSPHGTGTSCSTFTLPTITSTSGPLTIRFYSDSSTNCSGFALNISCFTPGPCTSPTAVATSLNLSAGSPAISAINGSFTAASPAPNNYLVVMSTSSTPPAAPTNGVSYTIGGTLAPGYTIVDNDTNTTFSATGLLSSTTYYFFVYSMNGGSCTGGPLYNSTPLTGNLTTTSPTYCTPSSDGPSQVYIDDVRFMGTLNDVDNLNTSYSTGYQNFTTLSNKAIQEAGQGINVYYFNQSYSGGAYVKAWVDWNKDGDFNDTGEEVYNTGTISTSSATFGFIIPTGTSPGNYRLRIRNNQNYSTFDDDTFYYDFNPCEDFIYDYGWAWDDYYDGEAEDYLFTVIAACPNIITAVTNGYACNSGSGGTVTLSATPSAGSVNWYANEFGGSPLTTTSGSWTTPTLTTTTTYWVTAINGCESAIRTKVVAEIRPLPDITFDPESLTICGEDVIHATGTVSSNLQELFSEDFEGGTLGIFQNVNGNSNGATIDALTAWQNHAGPYNPEAVTEVWSPAISSGLTGNHFVMSTSDVNPPSNVYQYLSLTTPEDATNFTNLVLTFDIYYSNFGDSFVVQINNGTGWTNVQTYTASVGIGTNFSSQTIDLSAYDDSASLSIRFQFLSGWGDGVALDNIKLEGIAPVTPNFGFSTTGFSAFSNISCAPGTEYTSGTSATEIWIKPTITQLGTSSTFTIPVSLSLPSGCSKTENLIITNKTKVFKAGTVGTDWNNASNWGPSGVPTADHCVIIEDDDVNVAGSGFNGLGKNLTIMPSGNLNLEAGNSVTITDFVNIETGGVLEIQDDASLIQVNDTYTSGSLTGTPVVNSGNGLVHRVTTGAALDYVYWSSPVDGHVVPSGTYRYYWDPVYVNPNGSQGYWLPAAGLTMAKGKGYIMRDVFSRDFSGVLRNGSITIPIQRGSLTAAGTSGGVPYTKDDDDWNLIGNPYPSAISASSFLAANNNVSTGILGAIYVWRHNLPLNNANPNPFYENFQLNYDINSYIVHNGTGSTPPGYNGYIPSGQGFFVNMVDGAAATSNVVFNNSMRNSTYNNSQFYRTANSTNNLTNDDIERHRIWLDIKNTTTNKSVTTLIGYIQGATNESDNMFDATPYASNTFNIYSLINTEKYLIQGRTLPFDVNDQVPLGFLVPSAGGYSIGINQLDGLFETTGQNIYLEDTQLGIIHDLRAAPYSFNATQGYNGTRFILRYTTNALSNNDFEFDNNVFVYTDNGITVKSSNESIKSVVVHDILGKLIYQNNKVSNTELNIQSVVKSNLAYIVNVELENGKSKNFKVIY